MIEKDGELEWSKPKKDDKSFVLRHCPRARVSRFPGNDVSFTCYLNRDPKVRESAYFWAPTEAIAWAEGRSAVEYDLRKKAELITA
jgi:hypothetical protein